MDKPRKPLRGLFTRTENDASAGLAVVDGEEGVRTPLAEVHSDSDDLRTIQYNFERHRTERTIWQESDYIRFLQRIDKAQTEAFFLKGKLITEVKDRFYAVNRIGWRSFCEAHLNMNYTTANQYIRVAGEFDTMSGQRQDFGFEHFKALLPLSPEERSRVLAQLPEHVSVKSLRGVVSETLTAKEHRKNPIESPSPRLFGRHILESLKKLEEDLSRLSQQQLTQDEKWKLYGALTRLSERMATFAKDLH